MSPVSSAARAEWSRRLARALVAGGFIAEPDLATHLVQATESNVPLSVILIQREPQLKDVVLNTLGQLARMRVVDLEAEPPTSEIRLLLPAMMALEYRAIPLRLGGNQIVVAFAEPPEQSDVSMLGNVLGREIVPVLANPILVDRMVQPAEAHVGNGSTALASEVGGMPPPAPPVLEALPGGLEDLGGGRHARLDDPGLAPLGPIDAVPTTTTTTTDPLGGAAAR